MSISVFDSRYFKIIQNYSPEEYHFAFEDDKIASNENKKKIQGVINSVLSESEEGINDIDVNAYESFLSHVEMIDEEYADRAYGHPFSDSIQQMRQKLTSYKQGKKDQAFKNIFSFIGNFNYAKLYSSKAIKNAEEIFEELANELIDDHLPDFSNAEKTSSIETAHKIRQIGEHCNSTKIVQIADKLELSVLKNDTVYRNLLSDALILIKDVTKAAGRINSFIKSLAPFFKEVDATLLLKRLYEVDDSMINLGVTDKKSPIAVAIELLEDYLKLPPRERPLPTREPIVEPKTKNTSFSSALSKFESTEIKSSEEPRLRKTVSTQKKVLTSEEKKGAFVKNLQTKLENLHDMKPGEIFEVISSLEKNRELFSLEDKEGIDALILALKLLRDPLAYKPSPEETALINRWGQLLISYGITADSYQQTIASTQREIKESLILIIQKNSDSFKKLQGAIGKALPLLEGQAITQRLLKAEVTTKQKSPFSMQIATNIANTIQHLQAYKTDAMSFLAQKWDSVVKTNDKKTKGEFSIIIKDVEYCNLGKQTESIEARLIETCLEQFMTTELFKQAAKQSVSAYGNELKELNTTKHYEKYLLKRYNGALPFLKWIGDHASYIKKVYNQGSDFNVNMGDGTCERNSEDRYKLLLQTPYTPSEKISLGSTSVGRFNQVTRNVIHNTYKENPEEAFRLLQEAYKRVGLNVKERIPVTKEPQQDSHEALYSKLGQLVMDKGETLFILGMGSIDGSPGHAINIQVDLTKPIYRFIDDNIGTVECPDEKTFKETLLSWLKTAYPDLPSFVLMTFSLYTK